MTERISKLVELTLAGEMFVEKMKTEYDREDLFLTETERDVKRLCEYILNQEPKLTPYSKMTGFFQFDGSVVGDAFRRGGHRATKEVMNHFYLKSVDNLSTMEWQHATADYKKVLEKGISGIIAEIDASLEQHTKMEEKAFLQGLKKVANAIIGWAHKCSDRAREMALTIENPEYQSNLLQLSEALKKVPEQAPSSLYEAILCIYVCFSADPDSVGTLDRYLAPFYERDKQEGRITEAEAKEYLQELYLELQAATSAKSDRFTRGAESHFCIGGYLPNGEDGFCDMSRLIVDSLLELPTWIPQVTLRWTKKTPREVLRYMMDCERKDPHKRIAFTNDEKRLKCYTEICGFPYERAVSYTTVGCNEPAFTGAITGSNSKINLLRSMETIFHRKAEMLEKVQDFDTFYHIFEQEMFADLEIAYTYDDKYNLERGKDINYISSLFFNDCIDNAKSLTQGGGNIVIASPMYMGITNVIDSLIVVKQFVFEEKVVSLQELAKALQANWKGYEDLRTIILKKGCFFGNDDQLSNSVAQRLYDSFYRFLKGKKNVYGYQWLVGDLTGYNEHFKWFGEKTKATPDGKYNGDAMKFGLGQSEGKDRNGLTALLNAIAKVDPHAIGCGSTVTNISLDEQLVKNDEHFEKLVDMFESYFQSGGVHFQLTYVSKEELIEAKKIPEEHKHLRVRVSGFSDYFVNLKESLQDEVIERTSQK